jgi:hypothetical protein
MKDGTMYSGIVHGIKDDQLILWEIGSQKKVSRKRAKTKAQISSLGGMGRLLGWGLRAGGGLPGLLGGFGGGQGPGGFNVGGVGRWLGLGLGALGFLVPMFTGFGI